MKLYYARLFGLLFSFSYNKLDKVNPLILDGVCKILDNLLELSLINLFSLFLLSVLVTLLTF